MSSDAVNTAPPAPPSASKSKRNPLLAIFSTVFIDLIGFSILIPVFPLLIDVTPGAPYRVTPQNWSYGTGLIMLGWLQAVYPFCIFLAAPILGQLSDRLGRRPVLAVSILGTAVGYVIFAFGISKGSIPLLFLGRAIDGFTGGNLAVAQAAIGDVSTNENRAKNFGLIGAAFGLGFILGPYVGGRLSAPGVSFYGLFKTPSWFGATTPFWFAAILAALNALLVITTLPETLKTKTTQKIQFTKSIRNVVAGFSSPRIRVPLLTAFLWGAGFTFFTTFFGVFLKNKFSFNPSQTGDYFAIVGVFIAITQGAIVGVVAKKLPDFKVLRFSVFLNGLALLGFVFASSKLPLYATIPVLALFQGLTQANISSLMSRSADQGKQGEVMGIYSSVSSLAQVPASALVGYITGSITSNTPLVVSAVLIVSAAVVFVLLFRPKFLAPAGAGAPPAAAH
jgi:MFS transporter, DHA1 family, tetracycline resistance protein